MFVQTIVNDKPAENIENEETYNKTEKENSLENLFKLRAPVVYKLEDMMMSLTLLLIISLVILILYGFSRFFIYLAYYKTQKRIQNMEIIEEFV